MIVDSPIFIFFCHTYINKVNYILTSAWPKTSFPHVLSGNRVRKMKKLLIGTFIISILFRSAYSEWPVPPAGWEDFYFGLVDDRNHLELNWNYPLLYEILGDAKGQGIQFHFRYRYLCSGVDTATNWFEWNWDWTQPSGQQVWLYADEADSIGLRPAWVFYSLQEEQGAAGLLRNANDLTFMKKYFWLVKWTAEQANGRKAVFVIEPDTWGYLLQAKKNNPDQYNEFKPAHVNDIPDFDILSDLPNNIQGVGRAIIRIIKHYAPDAYVGMHCNHWTYWPEGAVGNKMVAWERKYIDTSADHNAEFINSLIGEDPKDRGDFVIVEKYGLDAGVAGPDWMWTDPEMSNWVYWVKRLSQNLDMPALGWQIPIGHQGLPNAINRYEDTFMPYFFENKEEFLDAGIIGMLVGRGLSHGTDYSLTKGRGDDGWLFQHMAEFDKGRPYLEQTGINKNQSKKSNKDKLLCSVVKINNRSVIKIKLNSHKKNSGLKVSLYNLDGKLVKTLQYKMSGNNAAEVSITVPEIGKGMYVLKINASGVFSTMKFIH